jgi:methyl-accepting chemotaxis protein
MSDGANHQASSLEETHASATELAGTVRRNAEAVQAAEVKRLIDGSGSEIHASVDRTHGKAAAPRAAAGAPRLAAA